MSEIFNLDALFTYSDAAPMTEAAEVAAIEAAQLGDESATLALMEAYGPVLRDAVSNFGNGVAGGRNPWAGDYGTGTAAFTVDDLRQTAVMALLEVIADHDPMRNPRLAGRVRQVVAEKMGALYSDTLPTRVAERTMKRFYGILKEAEGDVAAARNLAPSREMTLATFDQILAVVRQDSLDELLSGDEGVSREVQARPVFTPSPVVDVEDRILADAALRACDDDEHRVVSLQYGFSPVVEFVDGQRVQVDRLPSDREIGDIIGMTRPTVQRRGKSALTKMRKALGVTVAGGAA